MLTEIREQSPALLRDYCDLQLSPAATPLGRPVGSPLPPEARSLHQVARAPRAVSALPAAYPTNPHATGGSALGQSPSVGRATLLRRSTSRCGCGGASITSVGSTSQVRGPPRRIRPGASPRAPAQRVNIVEAVGGRGEGPSGRSLPLWAPRSRRPLRCLDGISVVGMLQRFGSNPIRSRDPVRSRLDVQRRSQVDDHEVVASLQPSFELHRGDASLP